MAQVYFDCSSADEVLLDRRGAKVEDLSEAHACAVRFVQSLVTSPGREDWRKWVLHVKDEQDDELFVIRFSSVLGRPH
jgi:hypothetical protein